MMTRASEDGNHEPQGDPSNLRVRWPLLAALIDLVHLLKQSTPHLHDTEEAPSIMNDHQDGQWKTNSWVFS